MRDHSTSALKAAKKLRSEMTLPDVLLWQRLRTRSQGIKFRRQHPVGDYVADFYCVSAKLVVEIDGAAHRAGDRGQRDARRDDWMKQNGMQIIRIPVQDVLANPDEIANSLVTLCLESPPPSAAVAAATSPGGGGARSFN